MENIFEELGIPRKYLKSTNRDDRFIALVHKSWLKSLVKHSKLIDFNEKGKFDAWPQTEDEIGQSWIKIFINIFKKHEAKVIPLPRIRNTTIKDEPPLSFSQLMQYISQTNYKNHWKEAYKKYNSNSEHNKESQVTLTDYNQVLREIIIRTYGCQIVNVCDSSANVDISKNFSVNLNVLPALCGVETLNAIFLIHCPYVNHNLYDCVTFSPTVLERCYTKPLFIVYQLLNILKSLHGRSLTLGDITLSDIYLSEDLWILIFPQLKSNLYILDLPKIDNKKIPVNLSECNKNGHKYDNLKCILCGVRTYDKIQVTTETLEKLCQHWIEGQISNFTYLTALNNLSGRKLGDPNCHHVFPWVTDFSSRCGKNWRDLKKSKYRLNKGDRQLDLMYEDSQTQTPHHVSDVLSAITFYVYTARRTPKSVLCKNVRTIWVPAEYPSSIQRLQEWTPDECIPEFFNDPSVFKSIHDDLDDLEIPPWSTSPEDFIEKHREILESTHVSERLHHWIDLTFGYKLSGYAAIKAKNVCLQLVDGHSNLTCSGIVQLFNHPHPPRSLNNQFWGKVPPKIYIKRSPKYKTRDHSLSSVTVETEKSEEELDEDISYSQSSWSPLGISRLLSRSRSSLSEDHKEQKPSRSPSNQRSASVGPKNPTFMSHVTPKARPNQLSVPSTSLNTGIIYLPKEYNPAQALLNLENKHHFYSKIFHPEEARKIILSENVDNPNESNFNDTIQNAFTNRIFTETFEAKLRTSRATKSYTFPVDNQMYYKSRKSVEKSENLITCNYLEIIAGRRTKELQILGCLIVEIFMAKQLRSLGTTNLTNGNITISFSERLKSCITILRSCKNEIPSCIKYIANLLLQPQQLNLQDFKYPSVTNIGLPPPSAHLLLEPFLNRNIPFTPRYLILYNLLKHLKDFENITQELNILYHFDCNGQMCMEYENIERAKILFEQTIGESKVKSCARNMQYLLDDLNTTTDIEIVHLLVPYIKTLIEEPPTSVLAAWYLFDPIARVLGPKRTSEIFLDSLLKLYENEPTESTIPYNSKIAKLYHHSFLLRLIVRFGLKCFLEHFVTSLVEAIGGYRDYDKVDFILHTHEKITRKTSHLKTIDHEEQELSPSDDSSSSEKNLPVVKKETVKTESDEPELFEFETEDNQEPLQSLIEHLELNVASDLPYVPQAEEALDALNENDQLKNLEELSLNLNENYEEKPGLISPTIPIPSSYRQQDLNNISCDIGSKKSESEFSFEKKSDSLNFKNSLDSPSTNSERRRSLDYIYSASTESGNCSFLSKGVLKKKQDSKISDMSCDSLIWLSHRLGPVLTARYLSRNLLKMLTLCYVGKDNLLSASKEASASIDNLNAINVASSVVLGDTNASKVLDCLGSIAALYGEHIILLQYFPHIRELIALCKKKLTSNLEGGLISCMSLLKYIIPYLSDATLMTHLHEEILIHILLPCVRLLGSTKSTCPSGATLRNVLARKYIDTLYVLSLRMGADNTRTHLAVPYLQRFFLIFEKIKESADNSYLQEAPNKNVIKFPDETCDTKKNESITEYILKTRPPPQNIPMRLLDSDSIDSLSPPILGVTSTLETTIRAMDELRTVFTSELAYTSYMPFLRQIGLTALEISLKNHSTIHSLCQKYEEEHTNTDAKTTEMKNTEYQQPSTAIGSNVALVGNRIDVQILSEDGAATTANILNQISNKMENTSRHLRGNWLAYWEHEIGRSEKDTMFNFKQIKLQTFAGHTSSVKSLCVLDNENSFLSGSREKTVKLWSLRSQGDGSSVSTCQWTYTSHRKSIMAITFIECFRLVASCDDIVHIWDPFIGQLVGLLESPKYPPVNTIKAMPAPSSLIFAATTEGVIRVIDTRICCYTHDLKVNLNQGNLIRCLAIANSGLWVAAGQSSGYITVLDSRTGQIIATWRAHESEVLQLVPVGEDTLISSSLDQSISVWNVQDGKFNFHMKGATEPVHCLSLYNHELISGTTANRIGVHTSIGAEASFSSTKLRTDAFKGLLTSMAVLPLNRLLLLGANNGTISLLC